MHPDTENENGNYDFLIGVDVDSDHPEVEKEYINWGKWFLDTTHVDGFRLDAVKHISFEAERKWVVNMKEYKKQLTPNKELFVLGEYWANDCGKLVNYIKATDGQIHLFDVPFHYNCLQAATSNGQYDMGHLYQDTLSLNDPDHAITFVDNHDTEPGQSLSSFVPPWFKPIMYSLILLRAAGIPCIFYGAYYGLPSSGVSPVCGIKKLVKIRQLYAYGEEKMYFDDQNVVGFTRGGDQSHPNSGLAVLVTNFKGGKKRMEMGIPFVGMRMKDALLKNQNVVTIGEDGFGEFFVDDGSAAVWVTEGAWEYLYTEMMP